MAFIPKVQIPDRLYELYEREAIGRDMQFEELLEQRLEDAVLLDRSTRTMILTGPTLALLEEILSGGSLMGPDDLLKKVDRLAKIEFGSHRISLTPGQMEEVALRARKQGKSMPEMMKAMWARMSTEFFRYA